MRAAGRAQLIQQAASVQSRRNSCVVQESRCDGHFVLVSCRFWRTSNFMSEGALVIRQQLVAVLA